MCVMIFCLNYLPPELYRCLHNKPVRNGCRSSEASDASSTYGSQSPVYYAPEASCSISPISKVKCRFLVRSFNLEISLVKNYL